MTLHIENDDWWWFRELYSVLAAFADDPEHTISRIGGGRISIPDDQANDFGHFLECIVSKYPEAAELQVVRTSSEIDAILSRHSLGGDLFDPHFWTNAGFKDHPEWEKIRGLARGVLLR